MCEAGWADRHGRNPEDTLAEAFHVARLYNPQKVALFKPPDVDPKEHAQKLRDQEFMSHFL